MGEGVVAAAACVVMRVARRVAREASEALMVMEASRAVAAAKVEMVRAVVVDTRVDSKGVLVRTEEVDTEALEAMEAGAEEVEVATKGAVPKGAEGMVGPLVGAGQRAEGLQVPAAVLEAAATDEIAESEAVATQAARLQQAEAMAAEW